MLFTHLLRVARRLASMGNSMFSLFLEFWVFLRVRKKWWLAPIIVMLVLLSILIFFTQGSSVAPFVYTIF